MYEKVNSSLSPVEREKKIKQFWDDNKIFEKSMEVHKDDRSYVFYDGPPTANGRHVGGLFPHRRLLGGYGRSVRYLSQ